MIRDFLKNFVTRCGIALETEDKLLLGASRLRDEDGGLLRCNNERYYQFILWRAAFLEWSAQAEFSNHDLVILDPRKNPVVLFEMKRWMSPSGIPELPEMLTDLKKLTNTRIPNGVFIVFSSNNRGEMDTQLGRVDG